MRKYIVFYAPFGKNTPLEKIGGAEAGCLKTLEVYRNAGYDVVTIDKPVKSIGFGKYLLQLIWTPIMIVCALIKYDKSVLHVAGFYLKLAPYEWLLIRCAQLIKRKSIYEIRNGGMIESFIHGNKVYRFFMRGIFKNATMTLCQGKEYVNFLFEKFNIQGIYYPNYIQRRFQGYIKKEFIREPIQLIFVGRVVPEKNIEFIISVLLRLKHSGLPAQLTIIGAYDQEYHNTLIRLINANSLEADVRFKGRLVIDDIIVELEKADFFLFPTKENREGHSNALTEAMALGVVPIVSDKGFNRGIVGDNILVLENFDPELYTERLLDIKKNYRFYSDQVISRVNQHFTEEIVGDTFISNVSLLFNTH